MKHEIHRIPLYAGKLAIVVTHDANDLKKIFREDTVEDTGILEKYYLYGHCLTLAHDGTTCYTILLDFESLAGPITHGTLSHEALHAVNMLFKARGISYSLDDDEHAAYLLTWITDMIYAALIKWKLLSKVKLDNCNY
jgi:hypothetical protein